MIVPIFLKNTHKTLKNKILIVNTKISGKNNFQEIDLTRKAPPITSPYYNGGIYGIEIEGQRSSLVGEAYLRT